MKLTHLSIKNVLGIRSADLELSTPVTLFGAKNRNGKTSLSEAVRMALTGDVSARGIAMKKDLQGLVHDDAKSGTCEVTVDGKVAYVLLPAGKTTAPEEWTPPAALPYVLDAQRFAHLEPNMRRSFLFGLMGLRITPEVVLARLVKRGVDQEKAKLVLPYLRAGFPEASREAKTKATEAKGAWRALTGETYGSVKAASWAASKPEVDGAELDATAERIANLDSEIADANQALGRLRGALQAHQTRQAKVADLQAKVENRSRVAEKLARDEAELPDWDAKVAALEGTAAPVPTLNCPCCAAALVFKDGALAAAEQQDAAPVDRSKLPEYTRARDLMKSAIANGKRDLAAIDAAAAELQAIQDDESEVPKQSDIEEAQLALHNLVDKRGTQVTLLDKMKTDQRAATAADESTSKAAAHHATVMAWDAIGDALAPDGIPGDMLSEALEPFNTRLEQGALDSGWDHVKVGTDMSITVGTASKKGTRPYALLSESEQWRVDAMLAEAVSFLSGVKLLVLDRFDVLDLQGRAELLEWLDILASAGDVDTALIFGTLKQPPANLPASATAVWIEAGVAQLPQELQAA